MNNSREWNEGLDDDLFYIGHQLDDEGIFAIDTPIEQSDYDERFESIG